MVLQDELAGIVDGGPDGGNLNKHLGTVPAVLDHALDGLKMADGAGQAVQNGPGVFMGMVVAVFAVTMGIFVLMVMIMLVTVFDAMGMEIFVVMKVFIFGNEVFVLKNVVFGMQCIHLAGLLWYYILYRLKRQSLQLKPAVNKWFLEFVLTAGQAC